MKKHKLMWALVGVFILILGLNFLYLNSSNSSSTDYKLVLDYSTVKHMVENNEITQITFTDTRINALAKNGKKYYTYYLRDDRFLESLDKQKVKYTRVETQIANPILSALNTYALPLIGFILIIMFMQRYLESVMTLAGKEDKKAKDALHSGKTTVKFADVAGQEEAKESLAEILDIIKHKDKYEAIGAELPKGALLVGPPGTGKTLLAKALAGEADIPFFSHSGSEFVEMFVGRGASRVRKMFKEAKEKAPCILFIDEIDAIGKSRDAEQTNDEREQTLNQLLTEMDGFNTDKSVILLGATNRPEVLDKALLRPGRFDRQIVVDNPDVEGRQSILEVHSKGKKFTDDIDLNCIAKVTAGASGADLKNILNESALIAVRKSKTEISDKDIYEAIDIVIAGKEKKNHLLSVKDKKLVAYHEIGHALVAAKLDNTDPIHKITIVPRVNGSLGFTMQLPEEDKPLNSKSELENKICILLGGRASEEIKFKDVTTGASNDLERANTLARKMIAEFGMSEKMGLLCAYTSSSRFMGGVQSNCSQSTLSDVDNLVKSLLNTCYSKVKDIIKENIYTLDTSAEFLIEKETITGVEFMNIVNSKSIVKGGM